jgi:hypothetical protein
MRNLIIEIVFFCSMVVLVNLALDLHLVGHTPWPRASLGLGLLGLACWLSSGSQATDRWMSPRDRDAGASPPGEPPPRTNWLSYLCLLIALCLVVWTFHGVVHTGSRIYERDHLDWFFEIRTYGLHAPFANAPNGHWKVFPSIFYLVDSELLGGGQSFLLALGFVLALYMVRELSRWLPSEASSQRVVASAFFLALGFWSLKTDSLTWGFDAVAYHLTALLAVLAFGAWGRVLRDGPDESRGDLLVAIGFGLCASLCFGTGIAVFLTMLASGLLARRPTWTRWSLLLAVFTTYLVALRALGSPSSTGMASGSGAAPGEIALYTLRWLGCDLGRSIRVFVDEILGRGILNMELTTLSLGAAILLGFLVAVAYWYRNERGASAAGSLWLQLWGFGICVAIMMAVVRAGGEAPSRGLDYRYSVWRSLMLSGIIGWTVHCLHAARHRIPFRSTLDALLAAVSAALLLAIVPAQSRTLDMLVEHRRQSRLGLLGVLSGEIRDAKAIQAFFPPIRPRLEMQPYRAYLSGSDLKDSEWYRDRALWSRGQAVEALGLRLHHEAIRPLGPLEVIPLSSADPESGQRLSHVLFSAIFPGAGLPRSMVIAGPDSRVRGIAVPAGSDGALSRLLGLSPYHPSRLEGYLWGPPLSAADEVFLVRPDGSSMTRVPLDVGGRSLLVNHPGDRERRREEEAWEGSPAVLAECVVRDGDRLIHCKGGAKFEIVPDAAKGWVDFPLTATPDAPLSGWTFATSPGGAVERILLIGPDGDILNVLPSRRRSDVAAHYGLDPSRLYGFENNRRLEAVREMIVNGGRLFALTNEGEAAEFGYPSSFPGASRRGRPPAPRSGVER